MGSNSYGYDANGNMKSRIQSGTTYCQTFDSENRLVTVDQLSSGTCASPTVSATTKYIYDGNGSRLMRRVGSTTTLYVSGMEIELTVDVSAHTNSWQKATVYYPAGGAFRVLTSSTNTLYYRHGDHLGSTSVMSDSTGAKVSSSEVVFAPYGEPRASTSLPSYIDIGYTGQHLDRSTGATQSNSLMYYGARYYLPELRRFISADSIVPGMFNPQALNRYTYGFNNPVNLVDPTGHEPDCSDDVCSDIFNLNTQLAAYGVTVDFVAGTSLPDWLAALEMIKSAVEALGNMAADILRSAGAIDPSATAAFQDLFGPTSIFVEKDKENVPKGFSGMNCGWEGQNGDCQNKPKGKFSIEFALDEILAGGGAYTGLGLITHEIAHNVTWATGKQGDGLLSHTAFKSETDIGNADTVFGIQAGRHDSPYCKPENFWGPCEFSADAIANAALDTYFGDNADLARTTVANWLSDNIFDFINNMACTVGGSGYACSGQYK